MRTRRRGGSVLALTISALGLAQCDRDRSEPAAPTEAPVAQAPVQTSLGRADIVAALAQAASAYAAGAAAPEGAMIAGRTFEARLPFGCQGSRAEAAETAGSARWSRGEGGAIVLTLTPADWTRSPLVLPPGSPEPDWDGVEGFWIDRPWLASETCPRAPTPVVQTVTPPAEDGPASGPVETLQPLPLPPSPMTAGLAVIQGAEASRVGRRPGQPYSFTLRGVGDAPAVEPRDGYRLVLAGRVSRFPDGRAIHCVSETQDRRPACIAAVELDVVAFEDASGKRLSEWRPR